MSNTRKPNHLHLLDGTYRKDRHAPKLAHVVAMNPEPPDHLTEVEAAAWIELARECRQYLAQSDRVTVELAARLLAASRAGATSAAQDGLLAKLLDKIGATPAGRARLHPIDAYKPAENPFTAL